MKLLISFWFVLLLSNAVQGQDTAFFNKNGIAINGYDPVAYFTEGKAIQGKSEFSAVWKGVHWLFESSGNRTIFLDNPEAYAPQYGGYCAFGASENHLAPTDPQAWTIIDHKLYLNYNPSVKRQWLPDTARRIPMADAYWKALKLSH